MKRRQEQRRADLVQMRKASPLTNAARPDHRPDNSTKAKNNIYPSGVETTGTSRRDKEQSKGYATDKRIHLPVEPTSVRDQEPTPCRLPHACQTDQP